MVSYGRLDYWPAPCASAEQLQLQERDMADALWTLQTLIADFDFEEVDRYVLQHLRPAPPVPRP